MRRAHLGDGYYGQSSPADVMQEENDRIADSLRDKVKSLKLITIDIGTEVRLQNKLLNDMDDDFDNTTGFLGSSIRRVKAMARAGHNRYIFYLLLFAVIVFFVIWLIIKMR